MRKKILFLLAFFIITPAFAEVCNFGTMQPVVIFNAVPGATLNAKVYLYNPYGERILHAKVSNVVVPDGWIYSFEPEESIVTYEIPGGETQITENLAVEPMAPVNTTSGYEDADKYLPSPSMIGYYIPAKALTLKLDVPSDSPLWKTYDFSFTVRGWCAGSQPGSVAVSQERDFDFRVKTVALEYYERRVTSIWENIGQYAIYIALVGAIGITLIAIFILRKMGKLIINVEVK